MHKLALLAATGAIALFAAPAFAIPVSNTADYDFHAYDANNDNVISLSEARGAYPSLPEILFNQADEDKNGVLDEAEFGSLFGLTAGFDDRPTRNKSPW